MYQQISFEGLPISYHDYGQGFPLVFLHGYLLSSAVWLDFTADFTRDYRVICIDLPGHGSSGLPEEISSMELMAKVLKAVLDATGIEQAVIFGHSMGGYTALAALEAFPSIFKAISLFHSHTLADSDEVKNKRDREIKIIERGQRSLLISQSIPNMFATDTLKTFSNRLEQCKNLARQMSDKAVQAAIRGLKARPDRSAILKEAKVPCLNIIGRKDNFIPFEEVALKTALPEGSEQLILDQAGHMGFFEDPVVAQKGIHQFLNRIL